MKRNTTDRLRFCPRERDARRALALFTTETLPRRVHTSLRATYAKLPCRFRAYVREKIRWIILFFFYFYTYVLVYLLPSSRTRANRNTYDAYNNPVTQDVRTTLFFFFLCTPRILLAVMLCCFIPADYPRTRCNPPAVAPGERGQTAVIFITAGAPVTAAAHPAAAT